MISNEQQQALSLQRLKSIQKSTNHVKNLIENAKKMIYNQQQLSFNEKEILEVKISIQKDHLKKVFCKIDCPDNDFSVQIVRKQQAHKNAWLNHEGQNEPKQENVDDRSGQKTVINYSELKKIESSQNQQEYFSLNPHLSQKRQPDTKITISRITKQKSDYNSRQETPKNQNITVRSNKQQDQYEINLSDENLHQTVHIKPSKPSQIFVTTKTQTFQDKSQKPVSKDYFAQKQRLTPNDDYTPSFSNYRKQRLQFLNQQLSQKSSDIHQEFTSQFYQDEFFISTPKKEIQFISSHTQDKLFSKPTAKNQVDQKKKSPKTQLINFGQPQSKDVSSFDHYKSKEKLQESAPSTAYKEILYKNKQRLENSRQKLAPYPQTSKQPHYELHLDKLYKKKSESKKRLYGPKIQASSKTTSKEGLQSTTKKYSIANSHKLEKVRSKSKESIRKNKSSLKSLSISKNLTMTTPLSSARKSPLHSTTIKSYHSPCLKCAKCKGSHMSPKQDKQTFEKFYMVKKYLTPEGEQQCYNFLRAQGIPQKDWGTYVTEYVYRQLSRVFQEKSWGQNREVDPDENKI